MRERRTTETNLSPPTARDKTPTSGSEITTPSGRWFIADGSLGGYCGKTGLDLKRWLRRHEGAQL